MKCPWESLSTKDKIIRVVMDFIADEGFQNVTTRKIAARAGVNVAAINYYFGSKDALINEALKTVTQRLKKTFDCLKGEQENGETKLAKFIKEYTDTLFHYPDIIKNMINHVIHNKDFDERAEYLKFLENDGFELIKQTIGQIKTGEDEYYLKLKALHLLSSLSFPILMGEKVKNVMGVDFCKKEARDRYTEILLESIL
jgi:AcrR family transcriptional regulator